MSQFIKASSIHISDKVDIPERRLFVAVLSQAVHDAFADHVPPYEKSQAQAWLMSNSRDFRDICENAGRESKYVLEKIRRRILEKNGWNVNISLRTQPRRRRQMKKINKKHLTGNAYYAAKREQLTIIEGGK
jgi:cytochrome P450